MSIGYHLKPCQKRDSFFIEQQDISVGGAQAFSILQFRLLSLPKYMTELQFEVASLIPTHLPEGEGLFLPLLPGQGHT